MLYSLGILADEAGADAGAGNGAMTGGMGIVGLLIYIAFFGLILYFMLIRPQKKQRKKQEDLMNSIEPGDSIMTSSGFYGTILDVVDETTVIVEFGNNKNCRIPMHKRAIAEVEKAGTAEVTDEDSDK
ncbi:preprotein translocase subunit YajC [Eubacterium ruminantium]|uniref:Protein translocase subunit yajC n=2 Tax=Eubacterium TaxID=1730 RepID=A0A1T4NZD2_9FIRM|nr:preprotein translocase subunit YajC [Eubacterium sp.]SCW56621.1 preprotein translocase subunit YajC [Eubacterium ruminantium]SDN06591.1 protein translocase subunit yajC [Eubacterium ruminantium]SJZ84644.1 protein translocase subunit yajC [Eubacterium ruminantium]